MSINVNLAVHVNVVASQFVDNFLRYWWERRGAYHLDSGLPNESVRCARNDSQIAEMPLAIQAERELHGASQEIDVLRKLWDDGLKHDRVDLRLIRKGRRTQRFGWDSALRECVCAQ